MIMGKKENKVVLGIEVVKKMIEKEQVCKIGSLIEESKLTAEAVRYVLDNVDLCEFPQIVVEVTENKNYPFEDIYSSFEDYVTSNLAEGLFEESSSGEYIRWITAIPKSSEEVMELYNRLSQKSKDIMYKTLFYRRRRVSLSISTRKNYLNCLDAIKKLVCIHEGFEEGSEETCNHMIKWAYSIGYSFLESVAEEIGIEETLERVANRVSLRYSYGTTPCLLAEMKDVWMFLRDKSTISDQTMYSIMDYMCHSRWTADSRKHNINSPIYDFSEFDLYHYYGKELYKEISKDIIGETMEESESLVYFRRFSAYSIAEFLCYEDNENKRNTIFKIGIKVGGYAGFSNILLEITQEGMCFEVTTEMEELSKVMASNWDELFLKNNITKAKELIDLGDSCFIESGSITGFHRNKLLCEKIKLDEFDDAELALLSFKICFDEIDRYFFKRVVPVDFMIKHSDKISPDTVSRSILGSDTMPISDTMTLLERFGSDMNALVIERIMSKVLSQSEAIAARDMALLIKMARNDVLIPLNSIGVEQTTSIKSILTLL